MFPDDYNIKTRKHKLNTTKKCSITTHSRVVQQVWKGAKHFRFQIYYLKYTCLCGLTISQGIIEKKTSVLY